MYLIRFKERGVIYQYAMKACSKAQADEIAALKHRSNLIDVRKHSHVC